MQAVTLDGQSRELPRQLRAYTEQERPQKHAAALAARWRCVFAAWPVGSVVVASTVSVRAMQASSSVTRVATRTACVLACVGLVARWSIDEASTEHGRCRSAHYWAECAVIGSARQLIAASKPRTALASLWSRKLERLCWMSVTS
eukprot:6196019-Pleurochrysis_carterae.AAC.1